MHLKEEEAKFRWPSLPRVSALHVPLTQTWPFAFEEPVGNTNPKELKRLQHSCTACEHLSGMPAENSLLPVLPTLADSLSEKEKHLWGHPVRPCPEVEYGRAFLCWKSLTRDRNTVWPATNVTPRT